MPDGIEFSFFTLRVSTCSKKKAKEELMVVPWRLSRSALPLRREKEKRNKQGASAPL